MNANVSVLGKFFSVTTLALLAFGCSNKDEKTPSGGVGELLQPSPSDGQSPLDAAYQRACDKVFECASVSDKESLGRDMICVGTGIVRGRGKLQGGECEKASIALLECYASQSCDGQMQALQRAAEQVTQTIRILEVFDEAWAAFNAAERQELLLILVEKVVVNEPAGKLDIVFHDLGGPFDAAGDAPPVAATEETPA